MLSRSAILIMVLIFIGGCEKEYKSGSLSIVAELDTTYATIGDIVDYKVIITGIGERIVLFSPWQLEDPIEVRSMKVSDNDSGMNAEFQLVFWDTGYVTIPAYSVQILNSDSSFTFNFFTDSLNIQVISVLEHDPSMEQVEGGLRAVKAPLPVFAPWNRYRLLMVGFLMLIILGIIGTWLKRVKTRATRVASTPEFIESADLSALRRLDFLKSEKYVESGNVKEYYAQLSKIIREYIENSLYIRTMEMTTEEIKFNKSLFPYTEKEFDLMLNILKRADMAKFARQIPQSSKCWEDWNSVQSLILETTDYWKILKFDDKTS